MFWNSVWISCGKPLNNGLHKIRNKTKNIYHYQVRKYKRAEENIKKNKLLDMCLNSNVDLYQEVKKMRKSPPLTANSIDGVTEDIPSHFANIYKQPYNSNDDNENLKVLKEEVNGKIKSFHNDVNKVIEKLVKEATNCLKNSKSDPYFDFSSDCLKQGPDILYYHLFVMIKMFLIHYHVTPYRLLSTLIPIIKDKLGNRCSSNNYRSIVISSLIIKIIDWVIIHLFGDNLKLDQNQFAYQRNCSTTMCSWAVVETVDFFLRNNSDVFVCTQDLRKAFDLVSRSQLFVKLISSGLSLVFIRILMTIYSLQSIKVSWNGEESDTFTTSNGVLQGGTISAILFCFYCNELFHCLRRSGSGCWINGFFMGILGYSDDNILIAPSRSALQDMLNICENYAKEHQLHYSTDPNPNKSKTKCMKFMKKDRFVKPVELCGNPLPWVNAIKHLGHTIENKIDGLKSDMKIKRANLINKNNELIQEFSYHHPKTLFKLNWIYKSHFTGCQLWNLFCREVEMIEKTWNTSVRLILDVPRNTHTRFIEPISECSHIKNILISRFLRFIKSIW